MECIHVVDSHTGGEPTRVVLDGFPADPAALSMAQRRDRLRDVLNRYRRAVTLEPRGSDIMVGAWLCEPEHAGSVAGVVFFNNVGTLGMCGHGTMGVIETLRHLGRIGAGVHRLDTPVGTVSCTLHADHRVTVENVPSHRWLHRVALEVDGVGEVVGDVAWGGNWFFLVDWRRTPIARSEVDALTDAAWRIRLALEAQGITGRDGAPIDHIELFGAAPGVDSRSFVLCPGKAYDRSPCGTGTSAKLACLAAEGQLEPGAVWRQQSVIGSVFEGSYRLDEQGRVIPCVTGRAHVCGMATLMLDPADPFCWGIV
jgi:4-hydroxyproline epimerase